MEDKSTRINIEDVAVQAKDIQFLRDTKPNNRGLIEIHAIDKDKKPIVDSFTIHISKLVDTGEQLYLGELLEYLDENAHRVNIWYTGQFSNFKYQLRHVERESSFMGKEWSLIRWIEALFIEKTDDNELNIDDCEGAILGGQLLGCYYMAKEFKNKTNK